MRFDRSKFKDPLWITLNRSERDVLLYLSFYADDRNPQCICWPSVPTLCEASGMDKHTVLKALQGLEKKKAIAIARKNGCENHYYLSHWYTTPSKEKKLKKFRLFDAAELHKRDL
jgi:DNA-binding MarR family transcriptional regulator